MLLAVWALAATLPLRGAEVLRWEKLPDLPDPIGFAAPFAGVSGGALIVAGGANFPDRPPWQGGTKVWHDSIFVLEKPTLSLPSPDGERGNWKTGFKLPRPLGYGVSVNTDEGVLCIGGSDAKRHYAEVFLLKWNGNQISASEFPRLPKTVANFCGARLGNTIYVAGGIETPDSTTALKNFWALDLAKPEAGWNELEPWPGPERMLAAAAVQDGSFFLVSGVSLAADAEGKPVRTYLRDAYRYTPGQGWKQIADVPHPTVAAPSPAPSLGQSHFLVLGGDDGSKVGFEPLDEHPGFPKTILAYHTITDTWAKMGTLPASRVTVPTTWWQGQFVVPSGEARPGVRLPEVWRGRPVQKQSGFQKLDYAVLSFYLAVLVGMGCYFSRREQNTDDFFLAGKRIPWWAAGLSIVGTQLSAITFMATPAKAFATDWVYITGAIGIFAIAPLVIHYYLPFFRQLKVASAYEYLELRFNVAVRLFASAVFCIFQIGRMGVVLFLPSIALAAVTGLDVFTCILLMGVLATFYTVLGGIEAVIWTDVVQVVVLLGGAITCLFLIAGGIEGGFATLLSVGLADGKLHTFDWTWDVTATAVWIMLFGQAVHNLMPYTADQAVIQRYLTTRTEKQAARAIWTNGILTLPIFLLFFSMGTALYVFYKTHPHLLEPTLKTDAILPWFIAQNVPAGLAGLFVAAIFAAAMSSLDSSMNSVATAITTDFYRRFKAGVSDARCLRLARGLTVLLGVVGTGTALLMATSNIQSLLDTFLKLLGLLGGGLTGLFILGIFTRRANGRGALVGALISTFVVWWVQRHTNVHFFLYAAIAIVTCVSTGLIFSLLFGREKKSLAGLTLHSRPVDAP